MASANKFTSCHETHTTAITSWRKHQWYDRFRHICTFNVLLCYRQLHCNSFLIVRHVSSRTCSTEDAILSLTKFKVNTNWYIFYIKDKSKSIHPLNLYLKMKKKTWELTVELEKVIEQRSNMYAVQSLLSYHSVTFQLLDGRDSSIIFSSIY